MRGSKSKDTKPELAVRKELRRLGVGYRLHRKDLPGKPDIAMLGRRKAIFVHGCFWHQHMASNCPIARKPDSNTKYWDEKFLKNRKRDERNEHLVTEAGFDYLAIWECEIADGSFRKKLSEFLAFA